MGSISKLRKVSDEDRIGDLPDPILTQILSFLPTKSAVKTTLLSKRWKTLFLSLPNLDFVDNMWYHDDICGGISRHKINFINFVDRILMLREHNIDLDRFSLNCVGNYDLNHVDGWLLIVVGHNVKEINIAFSLKELYVLHQDVYMCASVEILRLNWGILVRVPENVGFLRLKVLEFIFSTFSSFESVEKLLLSCPLLENLVIKKCRWDRGCCLSICGSMLKNLILDSPIFGHLEKDEPKILIDTPALQTLKIRDQVCEDISIKEHLLHLTTASINVSLRLEHSVQSRVYSDIVFGLGHIMFGLLNKIDHVKYLTLCDSTLAVLNIVSDYCCPTFHKLTVLELLFDRSSYWKLLSNILARSPNLQSLVLPHGLVRMFSSKSPYMWSPPELVPECLSSHLKTIEIREFLGTDEELSVVKYLLKHGRSLRKISIACSHVSNYAKIQKELLNFCRGSKTCKLDLIYGCALDDN